ncbi:protein FAM217B [Pteropus vampyrus]|uniref:Protein FAM217B n=1 Tax=Pteropus vampyrus TaxID=132908 RepID=A0A6P6CQM6_PTEVA|nr:protein FAM217B [Pteropus vampyrus]
MKRKDGSSLPREQLGPSILEGSFFLSRRTEQKEKQTNERGSGGEKSFPNIRGIKKSPPQLSSSSNRLSKNISSTTEKTVRQTIDDDQPCEFFKTGNRVNESHQKSSGMIAGPSWNNAQRLKNSSGKRQSKPQELHVSPQPTSSLTGVPQPAGGEREGHVAPEGAAERGPPGPRCQGASGNKLFLAFQSLRIIKEDADEDSASDLSDSERVPMSPSPLSPPDLRLRAEEIDPVHFDRKRGCPREEGRAPGRPFQTPPEPLHVLSGSRLCSQKQTLDPRAEDKKKKASRGGRQPRWDPGDADSGPKIESSGNIRALKHSAMILDAVDSRKAPKTQAHANLKKKGNANSCGHAPLSSEKKLKTNGGKQSARKFQ